MKTRNATTVGLILAICAPLFGLGPFDKVPSAKVQQYTVQYALVPRDRLSEAVVSADAALKIEKDWWSAPALGPPRLVEGHRAEIKDFCVIVFVHTPKSDLAGGGVQGRLELSTPYPHTRPWEMIVQGLVWNGDSIFVIGGASSNFGFAEKISSDWKKYKWLSLHYTK